MGNVSTSGGIGSLGIGALGINDGDGISYQPSGGGFDPASVFGVGDFGIAIWPGGTNGAYQFSDATVPCTSDGDVIGYLTDFSGNNLPMTQGSGAVKGYYRLVNGIPAAGMNTGGTQYAQTATFSRTEDSDYTSYQAADMAGQVSSSPFRLETGAAAQTDLLFNYPAIGQVSIREAGSIRPNFISGLSSTGRYIFKIVRSGANVEISVVNGTPVSNTKGNQIFNGNNLFRLGGGFGGTATEMPYAFAMFIDRALTAQEQSDYEAALLTQFSGW